MFQAVQARVAEAVDGAFYFLPTKIILIEAILSAKNTNRGQIADKGIGRQNENSLKAL